MDPRFDYERNLVFEGNRLIHSDVPEQARHHVILPSNESLIGKMILHYNNSHALQDTTIVMLCEGFQIIHIC